MQDLTTILTEQRFFEGMRQDLVHEVADCSHIVTANVDDYLIREGVSADHFCIIRSGRVSVEMVSPNRGSVRIQSVEAGDILGWSWFIPPYRYRFDGRTVKPSEVIYIDGKKLRGRCENNHELGYEIFQRMALVIAQRLQAARLQLLDLYG
jgi:CRP-like cAMP-binding protein